jgi:hypothetical protein
MMQGPPGGQRGAFLFRFMHATMNPAATNVHFLIIIFPLWKMLTMALHLHARLFFGLFQVKFCKKGRISKWAGNCQEIEKVSL